jgi:Asp/Glu/hydantoin racemase
MLGQTIGVVTMHEPEAVVAYRRYIKQLGLDHFLSDKDPIRSVDFPTEDIAKAMSEPQLLVESVRRAAEALADDGCDAIEIGCGLYSPLCTMAGLTSVKNGKVPLLDPVLISFKMAETMVMLNQAFGTPFRSGTSAYAPVSPEDLNKIRKEYNLPPV